MAKVSTKKRVLKGTWRRDSRNLRNTDGTQTTVAAQWHTDAPGLYLHKSPCGYTVTHSPSGAQVLGQLPTLNAARRALLALGPAADWTVPTREDLQESVQNAPGFASYYADVRQACIYSADLPTLPESLKRTGKRLHNPDCMDVEAGEDVVEHDLTGYCADLYHNPRGIAVGIGKEYRARLSFGELTRITAADREYYRGNPITLHLPAEPVGERDLVRSTKSHTVYCWPRTLTAKQAQVLNIRIVDHSQDSNQERAA